MAENEQSDNKPQLVKSGRRLNLALSLLLVAAIAAGGFWYWQYHRSQEKNPDVQQKRWSQELSKIVILPHEKPLITTVLDKSKLTNKTLQAQAQNGDRLYIFSKAKQLILYRPNDKKIVNMLTIQSN
jgi:uncharacterized protein HemX